MKFEIKEVKKFRYIDEGEGDVIMLLHGLFGALSNFEDVIEKFSKTHRVIIPMLPLYELSLVNTSLSGLVKFINKFVKQTDINNLTLLGNSLGGHVGLLYTLKYPEMVKSLILTGSSGLFENQLGGSFPKRGSYEYIKDQTVNVFHNPEAATKELVDEVFDIVNDRAKVIRTIALSKSAIRNNLADELPKIKQPVCLIWGANDNVTPPHVADEFNRLIENSELHWIEECGHAPMMEKPSEFNEILDAYLNK